MTGRGRGACGTAAGIGRGFGGGMGFGRGFGGARGAGRSVGPGRGLGWFSVGYNGVGNADAEYGTDIKSALEARSAFLRAELARTEALLAASAKEDAGE